MKTRGVVGWVFVAVLATVGWVPTAAAQDAAKPYFMVIIDTSGSMSNSTGGGNNSCGQSRNRFNDAKCVIQQITNAYGDVVFGLERFQQPTCSGCANWQGIDCSSCNEITGANCPSDGGAAVQGEVLVPIFEDNQTDILEWVDFTCAAPNCSTAPGTNPELNYDIFGWTPNGGSLRGARRYYEGGDPNFASPIVNTDPFLGCRPYYVVLLTDGAETCTTYTDSEAAATELRTTVVPAVGTFDIRTYVIGFGITSPNTRIDNLATNGGTGPSGLYASDEESLALAFAQIIQDSVLAEVCDNADNDCDGLIDEGFAKYCDLPNSITSPILCVDPGDPCDGVDDNCFNGILDEPVNACNMCGALPTEVCNSFDDDCDGFVDEFPADCGSCSPEPEICDGKDNDCDARFDEGITRPCGSDVGVCTSGTEICTEQGSEQSSGTWGPCSGSPPGPEMCDGLDNDCDGLVDGFARECYTFMDGCVLGVGCDGICQTGTQLCQSGGWGACVGENGPATEVCNGLDDDCDGTVDEGNPGGGAACDSTCGMGVTECQNGMIVCAGGMGSMPEICNGFDDDCDGTVDEGNPDGGGSCDEGGTLCVPGTYECISGALQCVGGVAPTPEVCDCLDNDCDGTIDEENPDALCPSGASCLGQPYCLCARPCASSEFPCPADSVCTEPSDPPSGFCVPNPCVGVTCPTEEICVDGACVPICDTVTCGSPLVCRPADGLCVEDNCNGFPDRCAQNQFCVDGTCVPDPCDGVTCPSDEFCRQGFCVDSCAGVVCPVGQSCEAGSCASDRCGGVSCPEFRVCDPDTGECTQDQCIGVTCASGQTCDPVDGSCIIDPCLGIQCPGGQICHEGNCFAASDFLPDAGAGTLITAGGGGCDCRAANNGRSTPAWIGLLLLLGLVVLRHRRHHE